MIKIRNEWQRIGINNSNFLDHFAKDSIQGQLFYTYKQTTIHSGERFAWEMFVKSIATQTYRYPARMGIKLLPAYFPNLAIKFFPILLKLLLEPEHKINAYRHLQYAKSEECKRF